MCGPETLLPSLQALHKPQTSCWLATPPALQRSDTSCSVCHLPLKPPLPLGFGARGPPLGNPLRRHCMPRTPSASTCSDFHLLFASPAFLDLLGRMENSHLLNFPLLTCIEFLILFASACCLDLLGLTGNQRYCTFEPKTHNTYGHLAPGLLSLITLALSLTASLFAQPICQPSCLTPKGFENCFRG